MIRKIQILGAGAFVAFALVFAASEAMTPVASAAQASPEGAAEAAVGLAIVIALFRHKDTLNPDAFTNLKW